MSLLSRLGRPDEVDLSRVKRQPASIRISKKISVEFEDQLYAFLVEELKKIKATDDNAVEKAIEVLCNEYFETSGGHLAYEEKNELINDAIYELTGYGPITPLLNNRMITEIMVNGAKDVYYEEKGKIFKSDITFRDNNHLMRIIEKIVIPLGRRIDESSPLVDARLPDGSRVNAIIPPLAIKGPSLTIRKFSETPFTIHDLIRFGTLSDEMAQFIEASVKARLNVFISGGTGSGKTSTLNVLSSFIPPTERIVTIEDAAELKLNQEHVVTLEARPKNIEGEGEITIRDLVKNALRMRPDRIIVGEVRSAEALDMLQAMNTGHEGSLGTGHANSPRDLLARLETMVLMAGFDLPVKAIREQIASALDLIVHQTRMRDGSRKITHITEVLGLEGDTIVLQDIFVYKETGVDVNSKIIGTFKPTGIRPYCVEKLEIAGQMIPNRWFLEEWS